MSDFTGETKDGTQGNIEELMRLFPQVVTETKDGNGRLVRSVDFAALRELLGDDTSENDERYDFTWAGKKEAMREAARPIRKTLRPCKEESKNWDTTRNLYIEGDNLEALKILENTYHGQVKMIYIDPPYNTGHDFIYHDDAAHSEREEMLSAGEVDEDSGEQWVLNSTSNGRYHSDWCSMLSARLTLARRLLCDDGIIFVSIDDNEVVNARKILDEIFGEGNFVNQVVWKRNSSGKTVSKQLTINIEYLLIYAKSCDYEMNPVFKPLAESTIKMYSKDDNDGRGKYRLYPLQKPGAPGPETTYDYVDNTGKVWKCPAKGWRIKQSKLKALENDGRLCMENGTLSEKAYWNERASTGRLADTYWDDLPENNAGTGELSELFGTALFSNPKPVKYINRMLAAQTENCENDIVLDFFSGSATTAHAVMQLNAEDGGNRRFIMVQLPEVCAEDSEAAKAGFKNICEIGKERIRRAGEKMLAEWTGKRKSKENELALDGDGAAGVRALPPDIGFRVFKVSDSNMEDVFYSPNDVTQTMLPGLVNNVKEGRTGLDLLISTRLEWGLSIDCPIDEETVDGKTVFSVDGGQMLACFETGITDAFVKKLAMRKPQFAIFRDVDFKDSAAKINAREIFKAVCGKDAPTEVRFL